MTRKATLLCQNIVLLSELILELILVILHVNRVREPESENAKLIRTS